LKRLKQFLFERKLFENRFFWKCALIYKHGFYYHVWTNWFIEKRDTVFCGYVHHALDKESSSFKTIKARINAGEYNRTDLGADPSKGI
jgi:hypothetical protein